MDETRSKVRRKDRRLKPIQLERLSRRSHMPVKVNDWTIFIVPIFSRTFRLIERPAKPDLSRVLTPSVPAAPPVTSRAPDKRDTKRSPSWCVCTVKYASGEVRTGVVLDRSGSGARIRFRSRGQLPARIRLTAARLSIDAEADVVWQRGFDAGLRFV